MGQLEKGNGFTLKNWKPEHKMKCLNFDSLDTHIFVFLHILQYIFSMIYLIISEYINITSRILNETSFIRTDLRRREDI